MSNGIIHELRQMLGPDEQLCLLPIARVLVDEPKWLSEEMAVFPPHSVSPETLRVVGWPYQEYQRLFGQQSTNDDTIALAGSELHWAKSAATRIDLLEFFQSTLLGLPVKINWSAFLSPPDHDAHLEILAAAMATAEHTMDTVRFERCDLWTPQKLPGRAGLLLDTGFCAGLFYAPEDHESYIIGGQILTHQLIAGIGLDLTGSVMVQSPGDGQVGSILKHALRMYSEALEAATETSRFVQMMTLIEFLAAPDGYLSMKIAKKFIARLAAINRSDYDAILQDFFYLSSEGGRQPTQGLRHNIVHYGRRLEDLASKDERIAIFRRLTRYVGATLRIMKHHSDDDWSAIEEARAAAALRLGLFGKEAE